MHLVRTTTNRFFLEVLLATTDYDRFFLMVGEAKSLKRKEEHDDASPRASRK